MPCNVRTASAGCSIDNQSCRRLAHDLAYRDGRIGPDHIHPAVRGARARTRLVMLTAAGLKNRAGSMRLPENGALRLRATPALHDGAAKAVQSPDSILAVGTNAC